MGILHLSCVNDESDSGLDQSCLRFDQTVSVAKTTRLSFVDDGMECADLRLNGAFKCQRCGKGRVKAIFTKLLCCAEAMREQHPSQLSPRRRSSGLEDHDQVRSHDLSVSSSSCQMICFFFFLFCVYWM